MASPCQKRFFGTVMPFTGGQPTFFPIAECFWLTFRKSRIKYPALATKEHTLKSAIAITLQ
ncbi:MAG: hypothetical protein V7K76_25080 [Nostoc sp.]|uniref:hypothetical protein n=1 Tax=Nostoc sp. TaxID=1180 RepID=UPI002FF799D7